MRVYLKTEKIQDQNNHRPTSEIIAGGNVLRVRKEKFADGVSYYVDCSYAECEVLNGLGMTAPDPLIATPPPKKEKKAAPAKPATAPAVPAAPAAPKKPAPKPKTSVTELAGIPSNVLKALRRKYKTVESLKGVRAADLEEIKGIGEAMAKKIVKAAKSH
jgi:hypothetical protein